MTEETDPSGPTDSAAAAYPIQGGCLCGAVRFELAAAPVSAAYCHCTRCQRRTGAAASASARAASADLTLLSGAEFVRGWRHPDGGSEKRFCVNCGAHLFAFNPNAPERIAIRMAAFDVDPGVRPAYRQWLASAASWEPIPDDGLERYQGSGP